MSAKIKAKKKHDNPEEAATSTRPFDVGLGLMEALTLIARAVPILLKKNCQWSEDLDGNWDTACGNKFAYADGGPTENKALWCQYCGGELVAVPHPQNK